MTSLAEGTKQIGAPTSELLRNHEPVASPETIAKAEALYEAAVSHMEVERSTVLAAHMARSFNPVWTSAVPTMATMVGADSRLILALNPEFLCSMQDMASVKFGVVHEMGHPLLGHFSTGMPRDDQLWITAEEIIINSWVWKVLEMPSGKETMFYTVDDQGKLSEGGINPRKWHAQYAKDLRENGKTPVSFEEFTSHDMLCYSELKKMSKEYKPRTGTGCNHGDFFDPDSDLGDTIGNYGGSTTHGDEMADIEAQRIIEEAIHEAAAGDNSYRGPLNDLSAKTEHSEKGKKLWGSYGLGELRGDVQRSSVEVCYWKQWLRNATESVIEPYERLKFNPKIAHINPLLAIRRIGDGQKTRVLIAVDASGSMAEDLLTQILALIGNEMGLEVHSASWDGEIYAHEQGENLRGGGGTTLQCVVDYVSGASRDAADKLPNVESFGGYDAVVVVTDGYFSTNSINFDVGLSAPEKWVLLITPTPRGELGPELLIREDGGLDEGTPRPGVPYLDGHVHRLSPEDLTQ